jgi:hypothetical protein
MQFGDCGLGTVLQYEKMGDSSPFYRDEGQFCSSSIRGTVLHSIKQDNLRAIGDSGKGTVLHFWQGDGSSFQ